MSRSSILIISDDPEFARTATASWQAGWHSAEITVATSDIWRSSLPNAYDLVIVGGVRSGKAGMILSALGRSAATAVICVADDETGAILQAAHPHVTLIPLRDGWASSLIAVSSEGLRRVEAVGRAQRAERFALENQNCATLGRYMLEMRPSVNNALTSVLGNADLLLADSNSERQDSREKIQTIHTMALRLHEIMQRFSSLATEIRMNEKESQGETPGIAHNLAGGR